MMQIQPLDLNELSLFCEEIAQHITSNVIAVLPTERHYLVETLEHFFDLATLSTTQQPSRLNELHAILERLELTINLERYLVLSNKVQQAKTFISQYLSTSDHDELQMESKQKVETLSLFLLHKGIIRHRSQLESGNYATLVRAYRSGFISLTEASDAISAIVDCSHYLQLHQLDK